MHRVKDIFKRKSFTHSVEFFPPKKEQGMQELFETTIPSTLSIESKIPDFYSVTCGAGVHEKTLDIVCQIEERFAIPTVMHITGVGLSTTSIEKIVAEATARKVANFLALRGDNNHASQSKLLYAKDIVRFIKRKVADATVGVAGFPEGNNVFDEPVQKNWDYLVEKINNGADFVITQLFFKNDNFLKFRDYITKKLGYDFPIIAGILPLTSLNQLERFSKMTATELPKKLSMALERCKDDAEQFQARGIDFAIEQSEELMRENIAGIHYYCLNKSHAVKSIISALTFIS